MHILQHSILDVTVFWNNFFYILSNKCEWQERCRLVLFLSSRDPPPCFFQKKISRSSAMIFYFLLFEKKKIEKEEILDIGCIWNNVSTYCIDIRFSPKFFWMQLMISYNDSYRQINYFRILWQQNFQRIASQKRRHHQIHSGAM